MRRLRLPGGPMIRVREEPEGASRAQIPLFCIHGAGMSSVVWMDLVRRLAPGRHVIAPDLPGHGQSEAWQGDPASPSIDGYRDAVLAILTALGQERVTLAGHSMGAAIALRVALTAPDRVAGLVLFNGGARLRVSGEVLGMLEKTLPQPIPSRDDDAGDDDPFVDRMPDELADLCFSPRTLPDLRARWQAVLLSARRETVLGDFRACDGFDVRQEVPRLRAPTLVVAGGDDLMVPTKVLRGTAELIPGARLLEVPDAGHLTHLERPEAVYPVLDSFLSDLS